ncbi:MAG: 4'-phosphopantetheinyl transferase superfamily protein, partial [Methylotenera sp.]
NIGLSVSHELGMSLAAINMNGRVGIDVMAINSTPATNEIYTLAADYLGCQAAEHIARLPSEQQSKRFSETWTELEARLKCRGEPLAEWDPAKEQWLAACTSRVLQMLDGYVGTVAFLDSAASNVATTIPAD